MPFEEGQSGNPGGRPKVVAEIKELARAHTGEAIKTLVSIMAALWHFLAESPRR